MILTKIQGEHGIGIGKKEALLMEVGVDTLAVMKSIKQALDPHWIMNPGKIMNIPSRSRRSTEVWEKLDRKSLVLGLKDA